MSERVLIPTEEFRRNRTERPPGDQRGFEIGPEASFTGLFRRFISRFVYQSSRSVDESSRPNRQAAPPGATRHQSATSSARTGPLRDKYSRRFRLTTTNSVGSPPPLKAETPSASTRVFRPSRFIST